ncbi:DinI-like family protein [Thiomonas sp. FB-6]|uniref:DinI-like family protein n=1 Tax=Thiomonas sp. FB-6 TaxID=1158291 RepID=UPI000380095B|nr:DinI-like family protein [Thiomonas sp. FB-6]
MKTDFEDDTEPTVTCVTVHTSTGDIGEWDDIEAAEEAWQDYLRDELCAFLSERYPEAQVTVDVAHANGGNTRLDTDASDLDEDQLDQVIERIFEDFCNP